MHAFLQRLRSSASLRDIDVAFASLVQRMCGDVDESVLLAAALVSRVLGDRHICLDLAAPQTEALTDGDIPPTPPLEAWLAALRSPQAAPAVGAPGDRKPLILDQGNRLYLHRYWHYEHQLARILLAKATPVVDPDLSHNLGERLEQFFPSASEQGGDRQRLAAYAALRNALTIISGGPGTGKTYTLARILALLIEARRARSGDDPDIRLAAPTAKAAARMRESIRTAKRELDLDPEVLAAIPEEATTLHRLLGAVPGDPDFRQNADNPLDADVVIVDEASMVDLAMMSKLADALRPETRLVLLGDMDQLASVEPGCILGDICRAVDVNSFSASLLDAYMKDTGLTLNDTELRWDATPHWGATSHRDSADHLGDCVIHLSHSRRFAPGGPIDRLSAAVNAAETPQDAQNAWQLLLEIATDTGVDEDVAHQCHEVSAFRVRSDRLKTELQTCAACQGQDGHRDRALALGGETSWHGVAHHDSPASLVDAAGRPLRDFREIVLEGYRDYLNADDPAAAFAALDAFRILSPVRNGPCGVRTLNALVEDVLSLKGVATAPSELGLRRTLAPRAEWYDHRLVMITRNDHTQRLFNGDVGVALETVNEQGESMMLVYFEDRDEVGARTYRTVRPALLPEHETTFAMTIHKSQGSEFDRILVLVPRTDTPMLTKELLYTAITRTRRHVDLWCEETVFQAMVLRRTKRASGLRDALRTP